MNIFSDLLDAMASFVRNNPLTVVVIVMLAVFVPSLFGALLIGALILVLLLVAWPLIILFRLRRMGRRIEEEAARNFGEGYDPNRQYTRRERGERSTGDVKIYTASVKEKRVKSNVGDYVEFEEVESEKSVEKDGEE